MLHKKTAMALLVSGAAISSGAVADNYYDPALLTISDGAPEIKNIENVQKNLLRPGNYHLHVYVNGDSQFRVMPVTLAGLGDENPVPCLQYRDFIAIGISPSAPGVHLSDATKKNCLSVKEAVPEATWQLNAAAMTLKLSFPQSVMQKHAEDEILPGEWDEGISALLVEYQYSGSQILSAEEGESRTSDNYLNLNSGMNFGAWRLRNLSSWQKSSSDEQHWSTISTYVERTVAALKSELYLGDTYTSADVFDSVKLRGIQLVSDSGMQPGSLNGFAPVIHGIARTNATVTIREQNNVIYQTSVTPGSFTIDDLSSVSTGGTLDITVKESDGQETHYQQRYAASQRLQRQGAFRYSLAAGRYSSADSDEPDMSDDENTDDGNDPPAKDSESRDADLIQGNFAWGIPWDLTLSGGLLQTQDRYSAGNVGLGSDLGIFGALSADLTLARTTPVASDSTAQGKSLRLSYTRLFDWTGTNVQASLRRYSSDYYTLADAMHACQSCQRKKREYTVSVNQPLPGTWSFFASLNNAVYDNDERNSNYQLGLNFPLSRAQMSLSFSASQSADDQSDARWDRQIALSVSVPWDLFSTRQGNLTAMYTRDVGNSASAQVGYSATALEDRSLAWSAQSGKTFSRAGEDTSQSNLNMTLTGSRGSVAAGYAHESRQDRATIGLNGGVLVHSGGVTLGQYSTGAMALVSAPGMADLPLLGATAVRTDRSGYALLPDVATYSRDTIAFDTSQDMQTGNLGTVAQSIVPTRDAVVLARFETHPGQDFIATLQQGKQALPFGAVVQLSGEKERVFYVGNDGQVYLNGVAERGSLTVTLDSEQRCHVDYDLTHAIRIGKFATATLQCSEG
ncbi:fimbria/pilus outer membrane usher protein [Enterobacter sp. 22452]|uniref:fimbria/pilus outer membrane usher protein n=1 Tax=Enterobacter TaxID=547 RepID=UPI003F845B7F